MLKKITLTALILAVAGLVVLGSSTALAQSETTYPLIIQRIAEKFNLKPEEVNSVVNQTRQEQKTKFLADKKAQLEKNLTEKVSQGTITEAQKQAILEKFDGLQSRREQDRSDMEAWMKNNGLENIGPGLGFPGFKFGFGMRGMHGW